MSITIFEDKDCKGKSQAISGNIADLKNDPADKPSSIRLTSDTEAVLLFKNDDWHGGALYIRGPKTVSDLGSAQEGGRYGFGNSVRSVRVTPFQLDLNVTVVRDEDDNLPGDWKTQPQAKADIEAMVAAANDFYADERALLKLDIARITYRTAKNLFAISKLEQIVLPGEWTERGEVDVVFVHRFTKEGTIGRAFFPCWGQSVVVAKIVNETKGPDEKLTTDEMAVTLVHELGHHLGLSHNTANDNSNNLMFPSLSNASLASYLLTPDQIREIQDRLANNISRRGERN
jgi:Metallo-peptidase family M12B Reprolysin-like